MDTGPGGLASAEATRRFEREGPNSIPEPPRESALLRYGANFVHMMALLLWIGGVIAFVAGLPQLGVAIWVVNLINGVFSSWQEYRADQATEALRKLLPQSATVLRDGLATRVPAETLVPGDVVLLEEGDRISADARLVEHLSLRVDQSTLTGESRPVRKAAEACDTDGRARTELPNRVFAGTSVAAGRGKAVVTATGADTEFGRVAALTSEIEQALSPLQLELKRVSYTVSAIAVGIGILFFILALSLGGLSFERGFVFALGMIVAFVPEGLLPTVTLALAMGTQRMVHRQALVKRLSAVETLGSTTVICTDKTGTLTQNEMTVRWIAVADREYEVEGVGYGPSGAIAPPPDYQLHELLVTASLASNARLREPDEDHQRWSIVGDPTEGALLVAARKAGIDLDRLEVESPRLSELPFDSLRKRMSSIHPVGGIPTLMVKGAPAELLERAESVRGQGTDLELRAGLEARMEHYARQGLRVLGVARRDLSNVWSEGQTTEPDPDLLERSLEFLGLVAMEDPPRPEVADAVEQCHRGGIRTVMITGDYGLTAETVGRRIGLVQGEVEIINGPDLEILDDAQLANALEGEVLFARATPDQKLRVVAALQQKGHVVAVTGDGVNDAPALKRADIGVAMGVTGTDVAKEAADVILLDDNFASIVAAVEEGRAVYANIRKFTTYILTSNTPEAVPFILFAFSGGRIPLALDVMHILAIDLGTDLAPALALGAEPAEAGVMEQPPRRRSEHLIDRRLLGRAYLWLGPAQAAAVMLAFFGAYRLAGYSGWLDLPSDGAVYSSATAMALAMVVATQIGNLFAQRSRSLSLRTTGLGGNRLLWWGVASEIVVILLIVYLPPLQAVIGTAPFPPVGWLWLLMGIPLLPLIDEARKAISRKKGKT
ncbi:MAG TPA: cation-transporting P-type ATPase [Acidimicrobiia bacterium]|nr:cation-transporting P-type ATPase [Acidimicrobiia bacterium]